MNKNIKLGFTLLEVLVVVLIIATLASIAVPQYQRAVYKSRFHALMPVAKGIYQGNEVYYLGNRRYATNLSSLIVTGQNEYPDGTSVQLADNDNFSYVLVNRPGVNNNYVMYQSRSKQYPSNIHCEAKKGDAMATWWEEPKYLTGVLPKGMIPILFKGIRKMARLPLLIPTNPTLHSKKEIPVRPHKLMHVKICKPQVLNVRLLGSMEVVLILLMMTGPSVVQ